MMKIILIVSLLPTLIALTFGSLSGPVIGAPVLGAVAVYLTFACTPSSVLLMGHRIEAPAWSVVVRIASLILFAASCGYGAWVGLAG